MSRDDEKQENSINPHITSNNSGSYNPGPIPANAELDIVKAQQNDLELEEFADGPYGAATNAGKLGKSTPWRPGQRQMSAFRDQNPMTSDRKTVENESDWDASRGSIEGEN